jgi:hypothetical protein
LRGHSESWSVRYGRSPRRHLRISRNAASVRHEGIRVWHVCGTKPVLAHGRDDSLARGTYPDLVFLGGAGEGNRTLMTSLEGWGSAIELRPRAWRPGLRAR